MKRNACAIFLLFTVLWFISLTATGADVLTPCFLKLSLYTNITGSAVADLTTDPRYPASPNEVRYLRSFNTRDALPNDALDAYGGRIEGFLTPLESGDYHFFLRSDAGSELWLSTDETEANATLIADEMDRGEPFLEPEAGDAATSQPVTLMAGKRYFIKVLYKANTGGGNSTDVAQVAWRKVGDPTPALSLKPISGEFLSTLASDSGGPTVTITQQPQNFTAQENSKATFSVAATASPTNYVCIQWQRNGTNIAGGSGTNFTTFVNLTDNGAKYRAIVAVPGGFTNSAEAVLNVLGDQTRPSLLAAKGGPNRPEATLTFSERISTGSATNLANYRITAPSGAALGLTAAILSADRTQVTLKTDAQAIGTNYTVTVSNVTDLAGLVIATNTATFFARGPLLQGDDGFVVWEAEDYDRNLDGLWFADTERGVASGGVSMVNYNGAGGSENNTKLEYDIFFTKTGTNIIWWRFSGNDGNDDSAWVHFDGARIPGREAGNLAAISGTGTSLLGNWGWTASPFEGGGQMTFVIDTPGVHSIGIARREDGSYADKFLITTDPSFNPTVPFGTFGPAATLRQGEPLPPGVSFDIVLHPVSTQALENTSITLTAAASVPQGFLFNYQWQRKQANSFVDIPGAGGTNFTISPLTMAWNGAVIRWRVISAGVTKFSNEATITVIPETGVPQLIRATGSATPPRVVIVFSEPVTVASGQNTANYKIDGPAGSLAVSAAMLAPSGRTVTLDTGAQTVGAKYTVTVNGVADTAATPNIITNAQVKFYSLGALLPQNADGLLVFEAEQFARNLDGLWTEDTSRGNPSSGASVVVRTGGTETATQLEYDLTFTKTGTNILWYRASGNDGNSDSSWLWIDGGRPINRTNTANQASMTGFAGQPDFVWLSQPQEGGGQMTFIIGTAGPHILGLGRRENNAFFDKFVITTDASFNPNNYGPYGPPETRQGNPPLATIAISSPETNMQFNAGATIQIFVEVVANTRVISKVEYFAGASKIGESTNSPYTFTWQNVPAGTNSLTAVLTDDVGDTIRSRPVAVVVNAAQGIALTATLGPGGLTLNWTGGTAPFTLQKKISLLDAAWADVLTTNNPPATVQTPGSSGFFRIMTP